MGSVMDMSGPSVISAHPEGICLWDGCRRRGLLLLDASLSGRGAVSGFATSGGVLYFSAPGGCVTYLTLATISMGAMGKGTFCADFFPSLGLKGGLCHVGVATSNYHL